MAADGTVALPKFASRDHCLPWLLAMGLVYYALRWSRVHDTVSTKPARDDKMQMTLYCREIAVKGSQISDPIKKAFWRGGLLREGAYAHVFEALYEFQEPEDRHLPLACMPAIVQMAAGQPDVVKILNDVGGLIKVLINVGLGFYHDAEISALTCDTLSALVGLDHGLRMELFRYGAYQYASDTLERHPDDANAVRSAYNLAAWSANHAVQVHQKLHELDFIPRAVAALKKFPNFDDGVRVAAIGALTVLAVRPKGSPEVLADMIGYGVVEACMGALPMVTAENSQVRWDIASLLTGLVEQNQTARLTLLKADVPRIVASSLEVKFMPEFQSLQREADLAAFKLLETLVPSDAEGKLKEILPPLLEKARKKRPHNEVVVGGVKSLLSALGVTNKS